MITSCKKAEPRASGIVIGEGEHQYEVLHDWAKLPDSLTWQNYESVKSHVSPKKEDFGFKQVDWNMDLPDAVTEASKADKPLLLWLYFGNPLGHC